MGFNFESSRNNEVNEIADDQISSEQLSETEETAENFDDCSLYEVKDNSGNEVNSETLEEAEDDFEDCEAKMDELEEENPELNDEEDDNFDDCGNETEGQYVAEVTYTTDGEVSDEEIDAELQEAYDECDDPEDMQQLKENANENEHIEVVNAEVIERPEESNEDTEEKYEEAKQEYEEAQENLEEQQEAAEEYEEKLSENIEKEEAISENTNEIDAENGIENDESIQADDENTDESEDVNESQEGTFEDNTEQKDIVRETEEDTSETLEETELSDEEVEEVIEEKSEETEDAVEEQVEEKEEVLEDAEEVASEEIDESVEENIKSEEDLTEDEIKEQVEEDTSETLEETELSDEEVEEVIEEKSEETEETVEEQTEEKEEVLEDAEEVASEEIDESVEENVNSEENLTEDEIKEQVEEDTSETLEETELSDEEVAEVIEEKSEEIEETVKDEKDIKEIDEETEEIAENLEEKEEQLAEFKEEKDLSDRIDDALDKEDSSYSELNDLAKENANAIETVEKERSNVESEMSDKFDEVLSKERGTDEYKDALQEYNALKDQKAELDEKYSSLSERQDALERKSAELREAQIAKGNEAISESDNSLATAKVLEEKFDSTCYEAKIDSKALEQLSDENSALISELSSEKDAIKLAMDAKMDEISQYVSSNDMGRYETSVDPYYQKLNSEYLAMKSAYEKVDCSIVKLDENNRLLTEILPEGRKFGIYKVDENGFVKGANYNQYIDVWNNYSEEKNKVEMFDRPEIVTISPSLVEGIRLSEYDISNPSDFWSQHMSGGTEESFRNIAAQIPIVKKELDSGKSLSDIMENPELSECANIYFNPKNIPDVIKCGDYYEFQGNGRHRILAARNEGHDMPVNVIGERSRQVVDYKTDIEKSTNMPENFSDIAHSLHDEYRYKTSAEKFISNRSEFEKSIKVDEYNNNLEHYCEVNGYVEHADFSGFDPRVSYDLAKSVVEAKTDFPDLSINYIGSIDNQISGLHDTFEQSQYEFYKQNGIYDDYAKQLAKYDADNYIIQNGLDDTDGTYAWSLRTGNPILEKYDGVAVNNEYASDYNHFLENKQHDELSKWAPVGCGIPKACTDHELGHEIDKLLNASNDTVINDLYIYMMKSNQAYESLSGYSATNIKEFIAESYSEYRNNPMPRETSTAVYNRLIELRDQKILQKELKLNVR